MPSFSYNSNPIYSTCEKSHFEISGNEINDLQHLNIQDTDLYCSDKIYFNVGIDDRFGFEPEKDWDKISYFLENIQEL